MAVSLKSRVVKVEEVKDARNTPNYEIDAILRPQSATEQTSSKYGSSFTIRSGDNGVGRGSPDSGIEKEDDFRDESSDFVPALPEGWPRMPQLFRRRSCELTNAVSTCVGKATSHLELLQNVIEQWFSAAEEEIISRASSRTASASYVHDGAQKKHLRFIASASSSALRHTSVSQATVRSTASSRNNFSVVGIGASLPVGKATGEDDKAGLVEVPYLGAEEVIDEVMTLLGRLETDRQDTEAALKKEKERAKMLRIKIDNVSMKRMEEYPKAVQTEHEACHLDINEMKWHISYRTRNLQRIGGKVEIAEVLNKRLKEDIAFVKKHCPLVDEKLDLEREAINRIRAAQQETNSELDTTLQRCAKVKMKSEEAITKANAERDHIKQDLDSVRATLHHISGELATVRQTHVSYIEQCSEICQRLQDNVQETMVLEVKRENAKAAEAMQTAKVTELQTHLVETDLECKKLEGQAYELDKKLRKQTAENDHTCKEMDQAIAHKEERLKTISRKNQEQEMNIEDLVEKIDDCERQKIADEKNMKRMNREMVNTEKQMKVTLEEFSKVQTINNAIWEQLGSEEDKCRQIENALKMTCEGLKRQVKEEIHSRTVLQARISSDSTELVKSKVEAKQKNEKVSKKVNDIEQAVGDVLGKVEKLRGAHSDRENLIKNLNTEIDTTKQDLADSEKKFKDKKAELEPYLATVKTDVVNHEKRIDHMEWSTELMEKKMQEMDDSTIMMDRVTDSTQKAIEKLTNDFDELLMQLEAATKIKDDLTNSLEAVNSRMKDQSLTHSEHMNARHQTHKQHQEDLESSLRYNQELASQYRQLQNDYVILKGNFLNKFDERVTVETDIKDLKQLYALRQRMHSAMLNYYRCRGAYNESQLNKLQTESNNNGAKVSNLQSEMDSAIVAITDFLSNQMDGDTARKIAQVAVSRRESGILRQGTRTSLMRQSTSISVAT